MGTIVFISAVVLALGAWTAYDALRSRGRGLYLKAHFQRFERDLRHAGVAEAAAIEVVSKDPSLIAGLSGGTPPEPTEPVAPGAPEAPGEPASGPLATPRVTEAIKRLSEALAGTLAPDLLTFSDASGRVIPAPGFNSVPDYRGTRLFQDLKQGKVIRSELAVIDGQAYRVAGMPIRGQGGVVVGTVLMAQHLNRFLKDFAAISGSSNPSRQQRLSLVSGDRAIATTLSADEAEQLIAAAKKPRLIRENVDGDIIEFPVLDFDRDTTYDFVQGAATGYSGPEATAALGHFYMVRNRASEADKLRENTVKIASIFALAAALALAVGYLLAAQITRPLRRYIEVTGQLARGDADLTTRLEVRTKDELGTLAENLNQVFSQIHDLAGNVQRSAFQVGASSGEISSISKQMLDGARHQAQKISGSTAAVTELSSSIQQVAENAASASRSAKQSGAAVHDAIGRLAQIRKTVEDAASRIETLGESGRRIANIVDVIRQISEQTTMLALNAAIEAAHAGEHGRGFAVVADEVSGLAKRVGQSAKDIEDLIAAIRDQTGEAVRVMQDGTREVEQGTDLVSSTLGDLQSLIKVIDDTAFAVQEQAIASDEIARNMDTVQQIAEQVLGSSQSVVVTGEQLHSLAANLEESVQGFKIDRALPAAEPSGARLSLPSKSS
ncbi:MAG: methyl-accepting chemotaxis protein [Polyangiaceae bacterium]|nr:methyl-accepting chemotaxis protein [Polyangiaceae bacterium]MCW5791371.1 methyl-accepting chemotaxis protein [Polyangiaceae bacterium]